MKADIFCSCRQILAANFCVPACVTSPFCYASLNSWLTGNRIGPREYDQGGHPFAASRYYHSPVIPPSTPERRVSDSHFPSSDHSKTTSLVSCQRQGKRRKAKQMYCINRKLRMAALQATIMMPVQWLPQPRTVRSPKSAYIEYTKLS
jgi:hypothetical protein